MLRRPPTTLTITAEDVNAYSKRRAVEADMAAQQARAAEAAARQAAAASGGGGGGRGGAGLGQAMEGVLSQEAETRAARRARDERIGVTRRGGR